MGIAGSVSSSGSPSALPNARTALATGYGVYAWADVVVLGVEL